MTITHPDQMEKIREHDYDGIMFPRGVHQMVAYVFAMEGVPAYERSIHARMIEMVDAGEIEFFPVDGINMSGHDALGRRGECAKIRQKIEESTNGDNLRSIKARFGHDDLESTFDAVVGLIDIVHDHLSSGRRRAQRSRQYIGDLIWHTVCSPKQRERCTITAIADSYQIRHQLVSRDAEEVLRFLRRLNGDAFKDIEKKFANSGIIPRKCLDERGEHRV